MLRFIFKVLKILLIIVFWWSLFTNYPDIAVVILFGYLGYKAFFSKE